MISTDGMDSYKKLQLGFATMITQLGEPATRVLEDGFAQEIHRVGSIKYFPSVADLPSVRKRVPLIDFR
jgi:hypothetical protein